MTVGYDDREASEIMRDGLAHVQRTVRIPGHNEGITGTMMFLDIGHTVRLYIRGQDGWYYTTMTKET